VIIFKVAHVQLSGTKTQEHGGDDECASRSRFCEAVVLHHVLARCGLAEQVKLLL